MLRGIDTEHKEKVLGLEPRGRRPDVKQAVGATKGIRDFYGEGKI
jgi:hypothetical protein